MDFELIIVDDDKMVLCYHKILVQESGLSEDPLMFMNGRETLDYLLSGDYPKKIYCLLLDINMPVMNGWEFLEAVMQHPVNERLLVVMVTSSIDKADKKKAMEYPIVFEYLEKPLSLESLIEIKQKLLQDKLTRDPPLA